MKTEYFKIIIHINLDTSLIKLKHITKNLKKYSNKFLPILLIIRVWTKIVFKRCLPFHKYLLICVCMHIYIYIVKGLKISFRIEIK